MEEHVAICRELLQLAEAEQRALTDGSSEELTRCTAARRELLSRLDSVNPQLQRVADQWRSLSLAQRQTCPDIAVLVRQGQDLILKLTTANRDLEQAWARRGAGVPAATTSPGAQPHFVAELYRRMGTP
ncbi:MAG: hypothetical protein RMM51_05410 [Verrucomicrobiae bacterium]|nr:hypothetical protein [Verrucomicrobiae bacterium]